jgi:hypothetical protein
MYRGLPLTSLKRKPNAEERRRDLCGAAIELLAEDERVV